jgi:hypothetical protein
LKPEARAEFVPLNAPIEGVLRFMYLDVKALVTTGMGNLIDTPDEALSLPWRNADGSFATRAQIAAEWSYVKSRTDLKLHGGMAYEKVTRLRLDAAGVDAIVGRTLDRMDGQLAARFAEYESWPWQAQLATLSLAWACGAAFRFPKLEACLRAQNFATFTAGEDGLPYLTDGAAYHCTINAVGNPGVIPRNKKNRELYISAAEDVDTSPTFDLSNTKGLQGALTRLGYSPGPVDGIPGKRTLAATVAFQSDRGLKPDGIVGPKTREGLRLALLTA